MLETEQEYYSTLDEQDYIRNVAREQIIIEMSKKELMYDSLRMRKVQQDFEKIQF